MARCPFATWRPLPETATEPAITATQIVDHSIVGSAEGAYRYFRDSTNLESHFIVTLDGDIWQLVDTNRQADAQYRGNTRAISIETEDQGNPDAQPWTNPQLAALHRLHMWIADTHSIPRRRCRTWTDPGLGYHTMWGAPSNWTPISKTCPGRVRVQQWNDILLPAFISGQIDIEDPMFCNRGDTGDVVEYWQVLLRRLGYYRDPLEVDGIYGPGMSAAVLACRRDLGSSAKSGDHIDGWAAAQIQQAWIAKLAPEPATVELPDGLAFTGKITGDITGTATT